MTLAAHDGYGVATVNAHSKVAMPYVQCRPNCVWSRSRCADEHGACDVCLRQIVNRLGLSAPIKEVGTGDDPGNGA